MDNYPPLTLVRDVMFTELFRAFHPGSTNVTPEMKRDLLREMHRY